MELKTRIWETVEKMPVSLQVELLHYAEYLQEKYYQENPTQDNLMVKNQINKLKDIEEEDFFSLAGLWENREISIESIRKQAWLDRNK